MDTDTRSTIALFVSIGSLAVAGAGFVISAINALRDRPRLKISSRLYNDLDGNPYKITVTVVNKGRRPVILTKLGGACRSGGWVWTAFDSKNAGIRLGEHEHHEFEIDKEGVVGFDENGPDEPYDFMWIEDTLGNRRKIPNSQEYIAKMYP
jgi:hypothetical protein